MSSAFCHKSQKGRKSMDWRGILASPGAEMKDSTSLVYRSTCSHIRATNATVNMKSHRWDETWVCHLLSYLFPLIELLWPCKQAHWCEVPKYNPRIMQVLCGARIFLIRLNLQPINWTIQCVAFIFCEWKPFSFLQAFICLYYYRMVFYCLCLVHMCFDAPTE